MVVCQGSSEKNSIEFKSVSRAQNFCLPLKLSLQLPSMMACSIFFWMLLACIEHVSAFIVTAGSEQPLVTPVAAVITPTDLVRLRLPAPSTFITSPVLSQPPISTPSITTAPSAAPYVVRRQTQKCFNDQGFQVDCATWTGYYCTFLFVAHRGLD